MSGYPLIGLQLLTTLLVAWILGQALAQPLALVAPLLLGGLAAGGFARVMAQALTGPAARGPRRQRLVQAVFRLAVGVAAIGLLVSGLRAALAVL